MTSRKTATRAKPVTDITGQKQLAVPPAFPPASDFKDPADKRAAEYLNSAKPPPSPDRGVKNLEIVNDGTSPALQVARSFLNPVHVNTIVAETFIDNSNLDINAAIRVVRERAEKVIKADMSDMEATLVANVTALDAIFGTLAVYAQAHLKANKLQQFEMLMRMAFKAQSQVRTTIDSLAEIKNPRPVFAKQTNIANGPQQVNTTTGPQQVNNGAGQAEPEPPRGKNENRIPTNKLLEAV